jgi:tetratricopeptide (TPR) repeat protein
LHRRAAHGTLGRDSAIYDSLHRKARKAVPNVHKAVKTALPGKGRTRAGARMSSGVREQVESELDAQVAECSDAISRNPKDAKAYRQRGLLKARMRRYDDALHDLDHTLRLSPNDANAFGLRALVWAKKGDRSRAIADFDEAIRLAPQNAEMLRTHRQRVLSEIPREPIEGGDFNILKNPFVVLNLPPNAKPTTIKEAYEDAVEDGADDADVLMRAQQALLTPRLRTEPEVGGFLDVQPVIAAEIVSDIRSGVPIEEIGARLEKLHSLPRSNVIAHYGSARPLDLDGLRGLIAAQTAVAPGAVCDAINDVRRRSPWVASTGRPSERRFPSCWTASPKP